MATSVIIRDESMSGETLGEMTVEFPSEQITVNELIRSRVYQEVKESNARAAAKKHERRELVQPSAAELILNGTRSNNTASVNWQTQFDKAVDAFHANRIMILIDDRQVTSLHEQIEINSATRISFLRLTMLMGG
jgi:hypothetical protein